MVLLQKTHYVKPNESWFYNTKHGLTMHGIKTVVMQMVINTQKTWWLHFDYNKTMANFLKDMH